MTFSVFARINAGSRRMKHSSVRGCRIVGTQSVIAGGGTVDCFCRLGGGGWWRAGTLVADFPASDQTQNV